MHAPYPVNSDELSGCGATIDAWRGRGDHGFDPVRFRLIEALARRTATHRGEARRILDDKLAALLAAYGDDLEKARCADGSAATPPEKDPTRRGPLAALVEHAARHGAPPGPCQTAGDAAPGLAGFAELRALAYFKTTWSRLSADRRLTQALANVPENAGPLNSQHLVHRSLSLMRELSPEYLTRFMTYVDALLWLDQRNAASALAAADSPRTEGQKQKNVRGKSG